MGAKLPLIAWASRGAGAIGLVTAIIYLGLIIGDDEVGVPLAIGLLVLMTGAALMAWYADRFAPAAGRRVMWLAFVLFFVLGVLSVFTVGLLYLIAAALSIFSLSRSASGRSHANRS